MPKEFAFATFLVFTTSMLNAQTTLTSSEHAPRAGDSLTVTLLSTLPAIQTGRDALWDFSEAAMLGSHAVTFTGTDTVSAEEGGTVWRTALRNDTVLLTGFENRHTLMEFDTPLPLLRYPFSLGDSIHGCFSGIGVWCDRKFMRVWGEGATHADGEGSLMLPTGDTLRHVLLVHSVRRTWHADIDSVHTWSGLRRAVNREEADCPADTAFSPAVVSDTYAWYVPGDRHPVLRVEKASDALGSVSLTTMCPPGLQKDAGLDLENRPCQPAAPPAETGRAPDGESSPAALLTSHAFSYNAQAGSVTAAFCLSRPADVAVSLSDVAGVAWRTEERTYGAGGPHTITLSCAGLPHGQYAVRIACGAETFTEKFKVR